MRPPTARVARQARSQALPAALLTFLLLAGCAPQPEPVLYPTHKLVVGVRAGPAGWQIGPDGKPHGLEHDLVMQFASEAGLPLVTIPVDSASSLSRKLARDEVNLGIGGLYRAVDPIPPRASNGEPLPLTYTRGFHPVESVVIHNSDGFRPKGWSDLRGAVVSYIRATGLDAEVERLAREHPEVRFVSLDLPSADALIARVSESKVDYALVSSLQAALAQNVHLNFDVAFSAGSKLQLAWMLRDGDDSLRQRLDAFLERAQRSGLVDRLAHRYFGHAQQVPRIDAGVFQERIRTVLPVYRRHFLDAQEETGVEWRLLAAVAYQESQWEPSATSETGVRGFMQLTEQTAKQLGVADRLDVRENVLAAARYLRDLKSRLPKRIAEPDRTWLALAAFNIGLGHLEDARVLAQRHKLNPDLWQDVKQALPLLALPEYYEKTKLGYARGGMPVAFVERVRGYYDILLRHEPAHGPRLRVASHGS